MPASKKIDNDIDPFAELVDCMYSNPAMPFISRSSGAATVVSRISGLAPG